MLFFPIFIPISNRANKELSGGLYVKSGDKYTTDWWLNELECNVSKQKLAAHLMMFERQGMIKKIKITEFDVVRFKPIKPFSKTKIIEKLNEKFAKNT